MKSKNASKILSVPAVVALTASAFAWYPVYNTPCELHIQCGDSGNFFPDDIEAMMAQADFDGACYGGSAEATLHWECNIYIDQGTGAWYSC